MGERFGKFEILTKIATGGMAEIFLARQQGIEGFQKLVVIKRILPHLASDKEFVNMFLDEARMAALLNHPNIVQIYDLGVIDGSYFIAMEYIDGVDISSVLRQGRESKRFLRLGWILKIISNVCEGLYFAHTLKDSSGQSLNIIHRDITPENLLISFTGNVKITDFGIARARGRSTSTTSGTLKGKFPYMSYEMVKGLEIDSRSDIFSLGIVMWEMLTYRRLFKRDTEVASINAILNEDIPSPKRYFKNLPEGVERIVMKALERDRDKRFQTAREFGDAIENLISEKRILIRSSDLGDYLKTLFPDKGLLANREKLSSSKLQKIVVEKEIKDKSNSLPLITIQKMSPASESETVVLSSPATVEEKKVMEGSQVDRDISPLMESTSQSKSAESQSELFEGVMPLSEVMREVSLEGSEEDRKNTESDSTYKEEIEKTKVEEAENQAEIEVTQQIKEDKRGFSKKYIFVVIPVILLLILFLIYFTLKGGKVVREEGVAINKAVSLSTETDTRMANKGTESVSEDIPHNEKRMAGNDSKVERDRKESISIKTDNQKPQIEGYERSQGRDRAQGLAGKKAKIESTKMQSEQEPAVPLQEKEAPPQQVAMVEKKNGFVSIYSDPWAEVYLEDKKIGDTPLLKYEMGSGRYSLTLKNSEFGFERIVKVEIKPEEVTVSKIKFGKGLLSIETNIPVEVRLGKNLLGNTPLKNIDLYEGIYKITLFDPNQKKSKTIRVEIKSGAVTNVKENL